MIEPMVVRNRFNKLRHVFDTNTLTASAFLHTHPRTRPRIFFSQIEDTITLNKEEPQVSYQNLINKRFDARTFRRLMGIYLAMDNIIVEEKATADIAKEVKNNPNKCFSIRSELDWEGSPERADSDAQQSNISVLGTTQGTTTDLPSQQQINSKNHSGISPSKKTSNKSLDMADLATLTDAEVQELVQRKMKKLERFNFILEKKHLKFEALINLLSERQLLALKKFQIRCRGLLMRRKFILALRMNDAFEQKQNYMRLKKSLKAFQEGTAFGGKSIFDSTIRP